MMREKKTIGVLMLLFVACMSIPYLVPHCGFLALVGLVPLLWMERVADRAGIRRFWLWHYAAFVLWNAATTFWVWNATPGGAVFAILANALQMSLVFGLFRWVKRRTGEMPGYLFLAAAWIAWEYYYVTVAQISWPWLVLGNAFARSIRLIQWYEFTGHLGGSLWVWACNLALFGLLTARAEGRRTTRKAHAAALAATAVLFLGPPAVSAVLWHRYEETDRPVDVIVLQPDIDPYDKFKGMSQAQQTVILLDQLDHALRGTDTTRTLLAVAPETFTGGIVNNDIFMNKTVQRFLRFLGDHPNVRLLFGASTSDYLFSDERPSPTARYCGADLWTESRNSAFLLAHHGGYTVYHKSKLVPGVELTPYPRLFRPLDDWLSKLLKVNGLMGRCIGQDEVTTLRMGDIRIGTAICYESVYGEFCTGYVRAGAEMLAVITNDAWWGNTPGYRQHLSYASLRAIECRRDIARSANTGISAFINQRGEITAKTAWWVPAALQGTVNLNDWETFFVRYGDISGRVAVFVAVLLMLAALVRFRRT